MVFCIVGNMKDAPKDPASLAATCKRMAEAASDDKREYWLAMERFWLARIVPSKAAEQAEA
jgi:hypothetical protein